MENTTYSIVGSTTSHADPNATGAQSADTKLIATKQSMAWYIDLEILSLISDVQTSTIKADLKALLLDKLNNAEAKKLSALGYILTNKFPTANNMLDATEGKMAAFAQQVGVQKGKGIPTLTAENWKQRGEQVVADLNRAIAHPF